MSWPDLPYEGVRVLDVSQGFAGPYCGGILAQHGADVVKVEPPGGDWARGIGPAAGDHTAFSATPNVGKRSICVDARQPEGRALLQQLAQSADVVVQNFRPGVVERLGIADGHLRPTQPDLVYVSILGFGAGPYADRPATDAIVQAFTGMMLMNRDAQGRPRRIGMYAVDAAAGIYAAHLVGAALFARERGRGGRHVRVSLLEASAAFQAMPILDAAIQRGRPEPTPGSVPLGTFETADGQVNLSCVSTAMFHGLCRVLDRPGWIADPRLATPAGRLSHAAEITAEVVAALRTRPNAHWVEACAAEDVLCGPVNDYDAFLADAHVGQAGLVASLAGGSLDGMPMPLMPGLAARNTHLAAPPRVGAHTRQILGELGYGPEEIGRMLAAGLVEAPEEAA